ncbi:MAG: hypothetical protein ACOC1X_00140 [Promethearchaeota archaeon]
MKKPKKPDYLTYGERARKAKEKIMKKRCKICKKQFSEGGISAYEGICQKCINDN